MRTSLTIGLLASVLSAGLAAPAVAGPLEPVRVLEPATGPVPAASALGAELRARSRSSRLPAAVDAALAAPGRLPGHAVGEVLLEEGTDVDAWLASSPALRGVRIRHRFPEISALSFEVPRVALRGLLAAVAAEPRVRVSSAVPEVTLSAVPDDPRLAEQPHFGAQTGLLAAFDRTRGSRDVTVAVVDSGVDVTHPDLASKIVGAYNAMDGSSDVTDIAGHGTHVAGIAAAATGNGQGVAGAGHDTSILAVKAGDESLAADDAVQGILWAVGAGADIINASFGGAQPTPIEQAAVEVAQALDVLVVASAGNEGTQAANYPASFPGVISVGNTRADDVPAVDSNYGPLVDIGAPGEDVLSTMPPLALGGCGSAYCRIGGTSMSSPLVAGVAALRQAVRPRETAWQTWYAVLASGRDPRHNAFTYGVVDAAATVGALVPPAGPEVVSARQSGPDTVDVAWAAPVDDGGAPVTGFTVYGWAGDDEEPVSWLAGAAEASARLQVPATGTDWYFAVSATNAVDEGAMGGVTDEVAVAAATRTELVTIAPKPSGDATLVGGLVRYADDGSAVEGARVDVLAQTAGGFRVVGSATTGPDGVYRVALRPTVNTRLVAVHGGGRYTSRSQSAARVVSVTAKVAARAAATAVARGQAIGVSGSMLPARSGQAVVLERLVGGAWREVARGTTGSGGRYSLGVRAGSGGRWTLRVAAPAGRDYLAGVSGAVAVDVR